MNKHSVVALPCKPLLLSAAIFVSLSGCASIGGISSDGDEFRKGIYASAGIGASRLTPSVDNFPGLDVNDRVEPGGQATIGADLTPTFSVGAHSADLGSAGFSPSGAADGSSSAGRVNYHLNGISALAYLGKNKHNANRKGLTAYGRLGLAAISNSNVGSNLNFEREDTAPVVVGGGVEYGTNIGLGVRAEALTNGSDTSYGQVGVLYRLGLGSKKRPKLAQSVPVPAPLPKAPPVVAAAIPADGDRDGVIDRVDQCLSTPFGIAVDSTGCEAQAAMIDMVLFDVDSDVLTPQAKSILDNVAQQVVGKSNASLTLEGHADATGDSGYNMGLSDRRARNVARYLAGQGVKQSQFIDVDSYGETNPVQDNSTTSGRAANRRVEVFAKGIVR